MTPEDLTPRERILVLYLWSGLNTKAIAGLMKIKPSTLAEMVGLIGNRLPGSLGPQQKILLWKADHCASVLTTQLLAHRITPNNIGLPKNTS